MFLPPARDEGPRLPSVRPPETCFSAGGLFRLYDAVDATAPVEVGLGTDVGAGPASQPAAIAERPGVVAYDRPQTRCPPGLLWLRDRGRNWPPCISTTGWGGSRRASRPTLWCSIRRRRPCFRLPHRPFAPISTETHVRADDAWRRPGGAGDPTGREPVRLRSRTGRATRFAMRRSRRRLGGLFPKGSHTGRIGPVTKGRAGPDTSSKIRQPDLAFALAVGGTSEKICHKPLSRLRDSPPARR